MLAEFSQRARQVDERLERKIDRFRATLDRDPTPREASRLEREAVLDSRPSKRRLGDHVDLRGEWADRIDGLGHDPVGLVDDAVGGVPSTGRLTNEATVAMADQALAALTESSSTWRPNEVLRELARAVPTAVHEPPDHLVGRLEELTEHLLADGCVDPTPAGFGPVRRSDGRPTSESALDRRYTTEAILEEERAIADWADDRFSAPIVFRNEYQTALRNLSREGRCDLYGRTLVHAWRWTAAMPWQDRAPVDGYLVATNALTDSSDAERPGVRLERP